MILPVHQDPTDLSLNILTTRAYPPLTVLKQEVLKLGAWRLTFHIIGESHLVTIEQDESLVLCELLACVDVNVEACRHHHRFGDLKAHCFQQPGYSIDVEFTSTYNDAALEAENVLEVAFPEVGSQTPITRIIWSQVGDSAIRWRTLHVYPDSEKTVYVHSLSHFDTLNYNRAL